MFCFYYKWKISQALDLGKEIPEFLSRHINSCASCLQFLRASQSLTDKLSQESPHTLREQKHMLKEKIISALDKESRPARVPKPGFRYIPVLAASIIILAVTIGLVLNVANPADYNKDMTSTIELSKISVASLSLQDILGSVESPMEKEMENLKRSMKSTAEFLASCLDFNLGKSTDRI